MSTVLMKKSKCTQCGIELDAATSAYEDNIEPQEGDLTICFNCGAILMFNNNMLLVECPAEILAELDDDQFEMLMNTRDAVLEQIKEWKNPKK